MGLQFYAIAYNFQEDVYFDFEKSKDVHGLNSSCLLPTKELAEQIIEDELSIDYVPVLITIESYSSNGVLSHTRGQVDYWDIANEDATIISKHDAKRALTTYFSEEDINDFGYTKEQFQSFIQDYNSPIYETEFLRKTALCFDDLERTETGYIAYR